jgi:uncharacterized lipoprotein NlpE involved in copper resistance
LEKNLATKDTYAATLDGEMVSGIDMRHWWHNAYCHSIKSCLMMADCRATPTKSTLKASFTVFCAFSFVPLDAQKDYSHSMVAGGLLDTS